MHYPKTQQANFPACSRHYPFFMLSTKQGSCDNHFYLSILVSLDLGNELQIYRLRSESSNLVVLNLFRAVAHFYKNFDVFVLFCFVSHIYLPFTRKQIVSLYFEREVRIRLGVAFFEVYGPPVFHIKAGRPVKCLAQGHNKRTCRLVLHNLP